MVIERPHALQDTVLEHLRQHKVPVTIFLANGIRLQGYVTGFDSYSVLLGRDRQAQLIYKHAISTTLPGEPVRIGQSEEPAAAKVCSRLRPEGIQALSSVHPHVARPMTEWAWWPAHRLVHRLRAAAARLPLSPGHLE